MMEEKKIIEEIKDKKAWDNFIDKSPSGYIFHKWDFLKLIEKYSNCTLYMYQIKKGEKILALFPLFLKKIFVFNLIFSPPPQSGVPYLGFVLSKEFYALSQSRKESWLKIILNNVINIVESFSPIHVSILLTPNLVDVRHFIYKNYLTIPNYTGILDLKNSRENIFKKFDHSIRSDIKRSEKEKFNLVKENKINYLYNKIMQIYDLKRLKKPVFKEEYLNELLKMYPEHIQNYNIVDKENNILGSALIIKYKIAVIWLEATENKYGGYSFIIWCLVKELQKASKINKIDFCGLNKKSNSIFKSKFNPSLEVYYRIRKKTFLTKF
jgi:hypothetical protein